MDSIKSLMRSIAVLTPSKVRIIQLIRFVIAGGTTASLDFFMYWLMVSVLGWHYILAVTISFIVASSINYYISIKWVFFNGRFKNQLSEFLLFLFYTTLGLLLNYLILNIGVKYFGINKLYVRALSIVVVTIFNFVTKKFFVFKF